MSKYIVEPILGSQLNKGGEGGGPTSGITQQRADGRYVRRSGFNPFTDADEQKLDGIEDGATEDQSAEEIKNALESLAGDDRLSANAIKDISSGGSGFTPSKENIYEAVKEIFHPDSNPGVEPDDTNNELDVSGVDEDAVNVLIDAKTQNYLPLAGGTLTGALILAGAPTADLNPATKKYVDDLNTAGLTLGEQINTFTWTNSTSPVNNTSTEYADHDYLIFVGWIGSNPNDLNTFTTSIQRSQIPTAGTRMTIGPANNHSADSAEAILTLTAAGVMTLTPQGLNGDTGSVTVWGSNSPIALAKGEKGDPGAGSDLSLLEQEVHQNTSKTHDITVGSEASGWANANADTSQGGIALRTGSWNITQARAATYASVLTDSTSLSPGGGEALVIRLPHGTDSHLARVQFTSNSGDTYEGLVSGFRFLGSDSGGNTWDYYHNEQEIGALVTGLQLQLTGTASTNLSTFRGNLTQTNVYDQLKEIIIGDQVTADDATETVEIDPVVSLDNIDDTGASDGEVLTRVSGATAWAAPSGGGGGGISQDDADARYLRLNNVRTNLGDAADIRRRIEGELVASNTSRTIATSDLNKILHFWGNNANQTFTLPNVLSGNVPQGSRFFAHNGSSQTLTINPHSSDQINNGGAGNGVTLEPGELSIVWLANPADAANWFSRKLRENVAAAPAIDYATLIRVLDTFPTDLTSYSLDELIHVNDDLYRVSEQTNSNVTGVPGRRDFEQAGSTYQRFGIVSPAVTTPDSSSAALRAMGAFEHNVYVNGHPEILALTSYRAGTDDNAGIEIDAYAIVSKAAYETAKGSDVARNDMLSIHLARSGQTSRAVALTYRNTTLSINSVDYLVFNAVEDASNLAGFTGGNAAHQRIYNFHQFLRAAEGASAEFEIQIYAGANNGAPIQLPARKFTGSAKGLTPIHDDLQLIHSHQIADNVEKIQGLDARIDVTQHNFEELQATAIDLHQGSAKVVTWANTPSSANQALNLKNSNWTLTQARAATGWAQAETVAASAAIVNLDGRSYFVMRLEHNDDPRLFRIDYQDHLGRHIDYFYPQQLYNLGNSTSGTPIYKYYTIYKGAGTDGIGPLEEGNRLVLQQASTTTHINQTEFEGKLTGTFEMATLAAGFSAATLPAGTKGSIIRLTQAQYDGLNAATQGNGKLYSISDA